MIERKIPDIHNEKRLYVLRPLFGHHKNPVEPKLLRVENGIQVMDSMSHLPNERTEASYIAALEKLERQCEKKVIEACDMVNVHATVKTDPYSLPYKGEVVHTLNAGSDLMEAFEFSRVLKKIMTFILTKNLEKVRFYMFINVVENPRHIAGGINFGPLLNAFGSIEYRFRYHYNTDTLC